MIIKSIPSLVKITMVCRESIVERERNKRRCLPFILYYIQGIAVYSSLPKLYNGTKDFLGVRRLPLHHCLPPFFWIHLNRFKRRVRGWLAIFKQRKTNRHPLQLLTVSDVNYFKRIANQFRTTNTFQFG